MAPVGGDGDVTQLLEGIVHASKLPPKARHGDIKPTVAKLCSALYERGALPEALNDLIDVITTPNHLDQASLNSLARNLYPASRVPTDIVIRVVGCLGQGRLKASLNIQAGLIRWLILVHHVLEEPASLSRAYPVLFSLLDTAATR